MAFITLSGTLLDPNGDLAVGDQIRFTHKSTTGETVEGAISIITVNPVGTYSLPLQYGLVLVEYKDVRTQQFKNLGVATVNGSNPATSIPELLNALVPVSSAELIEFQDILANCVAAQNAAAVSAAAALVSENAAAASAATIDLINDLSQAYIFDTVALFKASSILFPDGKTIHLNDRDADFTKISGIGTANALDIIASTSVNQSISLITSNSIKVLQLGLLTGLATSDTVNAAINTSIYKRATALAKPLGRTIKSPTGEIVLTLDADTVVKDTFNSIGAAIELVSFVDFVGEGAATIGGTETGTRFILADGQNCNVLGNFDSAVAGLSGCWMDKFTVHGNRDNNLTAGDGIFIGSVFTATGFGIVKVGLTRNKGINIAATSTPVWQVGVFCGSTGEEGYYINGASSGAVNIMNLQCDNAGLNGGGSSGLKVAVGSTENTNINIFNYRYEQTSSGVSDNGIILDNLAGATVNIYGAYGFSNQAAAVDFIKTTGSTGRVNIIGTTCNSNYDNVYNDVVSGRVIPQSTSGIPALFESMQSWNGYLCRDKASGNIGTVNQNGASLDINNPADGSTADDVAIYGVNILSANFDESAQTGVNRGRVDTQSILVNSQPDATFALILSGPGNPNGRGDTSAPVGSMYLRTDGGAGATLFVKESGVGNTGWIAK